MKKKVLFFIVFIFLICVCCCLFCSGKNGKISLSKNDIPVPERWTTDEGINVIYYQDNEIPIVRANLYIKSDIENAKNPLAVYAMGNLLKQGGCQKYNADEIDLMLEKLSAKISTSWEDEQGEITFSALNGDFEKVFEIVANIIKAPTFDKKDIDLWKVKKIDSIKRRADSPDELASIKLKRVMYKGSNYGYVSNEDDVKKLKRKDIIEEWKNFVSPKDSYLTIVGPIKKEAIKNLIDKYLSDWKAKKVEQFGKQDYSYIPKAKEIYFIKKDDVNQATVFIASKGPKRNEENHVKYAVFSEYLGTGGFSSLMFKNLRIQHGLVYTTYGGLFPSYPYGALNLYFETGDDKIVDALKLVEGISVDVKKINDGKKDEAKFQNEKKSLDEIKEAFLNSRIFKSASLDNMTKREVTFRMWGFSKDYEDNFENNVKSFNFNDMEEIANQFLDLNQSYIVIVSSNKALDGLKKMVESQKNETLFSGFSLNICSIEKDSCEVFRKEN